MTTAPTPAEGFPPPAAEPAPALSGAAAPGA
jgi:hypothetical protein